MDISKIKRSANNEQYVSWKDENAKGTVLIAGDVDFANMSDAEKEAYVREHANIANPAPAAKMVNRAPAGGTAEELKAQAAPVAVATKPAT